MTSSEEKDYWVDLGNLAIEILEVFEKAKSQKICDVCKEPADIFWDCKALNKQICLQCKDSFLVALADLFTELDKEEGAN